MQSKDDTANKMTIAQQGENLSDETCCQGKVHIAFRGISDDRMYLVRNRNRTEVKYFRPHGLRVFCTHCRRRLL